MHYRRGGLYLQTEKITAIFGANEPKISIAPTDGKLSNFILCGTEKVKRKTRVPIPFCVFASISAARSL